MVEYRFEFTIKQFFPGAFNGLVNNLIEFLVGVINALPTNWSFINAYISGDKLILNLNGPAVSGAGVNQQIIFTTAAIVSIIQAALFVIGLVAVAWKITDTVENIQVEKIKSLEEQLKEGYITSEEYLSSLRAKNPFTSTIQNVAYGLLIIGGGFLMVNYFSKR